MATAEATTPQALLSAARDLVHIDDPETAGLWPRAAALPDCQALEAAMASLWERSAPGLEAATLRCQLLCLADFLRDPALAGRVHLTWEGLTRACHLRVYELAPTAQELLGWLETVWDLAEVVAASENGDPRRRESVCPRLTAIDRARGALSS